MSCRFFVSLHSAGQRTPVDFGQAREGEHEQHTTRLVRILLTLTLTLLPAPGLALAPAQQSTLTGRVVTPAGTPAPGADVFLLETLEGATADSAGRFTISTSRRGPATLVAHGVGYAETRVAVVLPRAAPIELVVEIVSVQLAPLDVRASSYAAGAGEAAELTSLQVVSTPGAHADVLQAVGAFPGVQPVSESAGLYVRGGDVAETKVLLDGAVVLAPYRFEDGLTSFGTFDPFQLEGIAFSTGGFGARHGDAIGGLLELETAGRPARRDAGLTASLAAVSGTVALPLPHGLGLRATVNRSHTGLLFRLNGHDTEFRNVPESRNAAIGAAWQYRPGGEAKLYAYDEWNRFAVQVEAPAYAGALTSDDASRVAVVSVEDAAGDVGIAGSASISTRSQRQSFGAFRLEQDDRLAQARFELSRQVLSGLLLRAGAEGELRSAALAGSYPQAGEDPRPGARVTVFDSEVDGSRTALFTEAEWRPADPLELTAGLRSDRSSLTGTRTWDPRLAGALRIGSDAALTFAWGRYHQVPAPGFFERSPSLQPPASSLSPMSATHRVVGLVAGSGERMLRIEAYDVSRGDLVARDRDHVVRPGGRGRARGIDIFVRGPAIFGIRGRASYSLIDARRTDPDTGVMATSPYEIRHALTLIAERALSDALGLAVALRHATGRPYTPVVGAVRDSAADIWRPIRAAPFSDRLPAYTRVDLSAQWLHSFTGDDVTVLFVSITNLLDRVNIAGHRYSADYAERESIDAAFRRTLYFGITSTFPF